MKYICSKPNWHLLIAVLLIVTVTGASRTTQWVKALATKPENLEFDARDPLVGENGLLQTVLLPPHTNSKKTIKKTNDVVSIYLVPSVGSEMNSDIMGDILSSCPSLWSLLSPCFWLIGLTGCGN